jgi:succinate dehydrogenase / fumarate reductase flavoprotein subunit
MRARWCGVLAWDMVNGGFHCSTPRPRFSPPAATPGSFRTTSNAHICSGDGAALAMRAGLPAQDLEFLQFHPTGIFGAGNLITEGVRGEGGYLLNCYDDRFMTVCAPSEKDLACRDVVSRGMAEELRGGRGCGDKQDTSFYSRWTTSARTRSWSGCPASGNWPWCSPAWTAPRSPSRWCPLPTIPWAAVPTNYHAEVVAPGSGRQEQVVPGFYAAGEAACAIGARGQPPGHQLAAGP